MAHFAELNEENVVQRVIVVHNNELLDGEQNEVEQLGIDFCVAHYGGRWIQTSYNGNIRYNYAGLGVSYDADADAFIAPRPTCGHKELFLNDKYKWNCQGCDFSNEA